MSGGRVAIHVDKDATRPSAHLAFHQSQIVRVQNPILEALRPVHGQRRGAIQVPSPGVKRADDLPSPERAAALGQLRTPVPALILIGLDFRPRAHHEDRIVRNAILDIITDIGDLLEPAGHLPHPRPQPFVLQLEELPVEIALARNVRAIRDREGHSESVHSNRFLYRGTRRQYLCQHTLHQIRANTTLPLN